MQDIKVEEIKKGMLIREGAGVKLHRYIGTDNRNDLEPFLLLDYFNSRDPLDYMAGFPSHPHRGFETITYLLAGQITHGDNKGHKGVIRAGDVQWMTAGKGIIHSEMPSAEERIQGLQLWLNLPAKAKMCEPRYQEVVSAQLPVERQNSGIRVKVIAGQTDKGTASPITGIATNPLFFDITFPGDTRIEQHIPKEYQAIVFVISGAVTVGDQIISQDELAKLSAGDKITLHAETASQVLLIAALKLHEPIVRHGPFVMNTKEQIMQAMEDFRGGTFGL